MRSGREALSGPLRVGLGSRLSLLRSAHRSGRRSRVRGSSMRTGLGSRFSCKRGFLAEAWLCYRWEQECYTSFVILAGLGIALVLIDGWVWFGRAVLVGLLL